MYKQPAIVYSSPVSPVELEVAKCRQRYMHTCARTQFTHYQLFSYRSGKCLMYDGYTAMMP